MDAEQNAFDELCGYTLSRGDAAFIHQQVVDAFAVQKADEQTKPIKITFGLVGLYLHIEKQFSGRRVQRAHMSLAKQKRDLAVVWPAKSPRTRYRGRGPGCIPGTRARPGDRCLVPLGLARVSRKPPNSQVRFCFARLM